MKFILAEKREMTQKFAADGTVIPVTKLSVSPCVVTQIKTDKQDGYSAVQLGTGQKRKLAKPLKGHLKDLGSFRHLKEFRLKTEDDRTQADGLHVGDTISVTTFDPGDKVQVTGIAKGRGFQGVVKRHGFHGSPASHGHKDQLRMPGSIGPTGPARVFKGMRMPGQMGNSQVTIANLEVVAVDPQQHELFIKGAIPGARGTLIIVSGPGALKLATEKKPTQPESIEPLAETAAAPVQSVPVEESKAEPSPAPTVEKPAAKFEPPTEQTPA